MAVYYALCRASCDQFQQNGCKNTAEDQSGQEQTANVSFQCSSADTYHHQRTAETAAAQRVLACLLYRCFGVSMHAHHILRPGKNPILKICHIISVSRTAVDGWHVRWGGNPAGLMSRRICQSLRPRAYMPLRVVGFLSKIIKDFCREKIFILCGVKMKHISNLSVQDCAPRCGSWKRKTDVFMYQIGNRGYYIGVAHRFLRYIFVFVCPYRYRVSMSICRAMQQPKHGACLCKQQI